MPSNLWQVHDWNKFEPISRANPLGMKGHLAQRYGELVKDLWSGNSKCIAPLKFRVSIRIGIDGHLTSKYFFGHKLWGTRFYIFETKSYHLHFNMHFCWFVCYRNSSISSNSQK